MKKALILLGSLLGLALAQSVEVEVKGSLDSVLDRLVAALRAQGLEVDRNLNLGEQVRQVTGPGFPDYRLVVLKPEEGSMEASNREWSPWGRLTAVSFSRCSRSGPLRRRNSPGASRPSWKAWGSSSGFPQPSCPTPKAG